MQKFKSKIVNQPKLKIELSKTDYIPEVLSVVCIISVILQLVLSWTELPEKIVTHFNLSGEPDSTGSKFTLLLLPSIIVMIYFLLTIINRYPHVFNYPVTINPDNALFQYRNAAVTIRILKLIILSFFSYVFHCVVYTSLGIIRGLNIVIVVIFFVTIFYVLIWSISNSIKNKK